LSRAPPIKFPKKIEEKRAQPPAHVFERRNEGYHYEILSHNSKPHIM